MSAQRTVFSFKNVKHFKRGATWPDGSTRTCTVCRRDEDIHRAKQATTVANIVHTGSKYKVPVGYCSEHTPEEIR